MAIWPSASAEPRRRDSRPALAALIMTVFLAGAMIWQIEAERREARAHALAQAHDLLRRCRDIADAYLREQRREGERRQEEMVRLAASLADDFQLRIQSALAAAARCRAEQPWAALAQLWGWAPPDAIASDWPETALLTVSADLAQRIPPNCAVAVCEEGGRLLLRLTGKTPPASERLIEAVRRLEFSLRDKPRVWFINISLAPPAFAEPTAVEIAERLGPQLGVVESENLMVRGVIIGADSKVLEVFPPFAPGPRVMPLPPRSGEWLAIDDLARPRLTRLERIQLASAPWSIGMQISIDAPTLLVAMQKRISEDWRWAGLFGLSACAFCLFLIAAPLRTLPASTPPAAVTAAPRLIPKAGAAQSRAGVTFAEVIAKDGQTTLMLQDGNQLRQGAPGESLKRLQQLHRGSPVLGGTRILDHARSPLLRELAKKVRPARRGEQRSRRGEVDMERACTKNTGP